MSDRVLYTPPIPWPQFPLAAFCDGCASAVSLHQAAQHRHGCGK